MEAVVGKTVLQVLRFSQHCGWGVYSSGIWGCVTGCWVPDVSRQRSLFIFRSVNVQQPEEILTFETENIVLFWNFDNSLLSEDALYRKVRIPHSRSCPCLQFNGKSGSRGIAPRILKLNSGLRWVVSFTPLLYFQESRWNSLSMKLGGPHPVWALWTRETSIALSSNRKTCSP
jgi:hypothetical protein